MARPARLRAVRSPRGDGTYDVSLFVEGGEDSGALVAYMPFENVPTLMNDLRLALSGEALSAAERVPA